MPLVKGNQDILRTGLGGRPDGLEDVIPDPIQEDGETVRTEQYAEIRDTPRYYKSD
jgi:hypothetical protein